MKTGGDAARELFKENLNYYMNTRNITQSDIVASLKVSSATASDWVNGVKYPRVDAMQALAELLEVNMSDLMSDKNKDQPSNGNGDLSVLREQLRRKPKQRILFDRSKELTDSQIDVVLGVVNEILKDRNNDDI